MNLKVIFICKNCIVEFYFNNKLHRHVKKCRITFTDVHATVIEVTNQLSMIKFIKKNRNHHDFVFRLYRYATIKATLTQTIIMNEMCVDNETFMFLIDRKFLAAKYLNFEIHKMFSFNNVRSIETKLHDTSFYVIFDFYISGKVNKNRQIFVHFNDEVHLINDLKINVFIEMNIMSPKRMKLNFENNSLTIITCQDFKASIQIKQRSEIINRSIRVVAKIIISFYAIMSMSIRIRKKFLSKNKNYNFFFKKQKMLNPENGFFVHVTNVNIVTMQIQNAFTKSFVILKNLKIDNLTNYAKKECYLANSKQRHLIIVFDKIDLKKIFKTETILQNGVTIYENDETIIKIVSIIDNYPRLFKEISSTMQISQNQWMKIKIFFDLKSKLMRVFKLNTKNKKTVNKKFDELHKREKMKWSIKSTSYVYSIFVMWHTICLSKKSSLRKTRIIVDIRGLNKISKFDVYFMSLQNDIISSMQNCKFIFIMNVMVFFHQWWIAKENKHKLIVMIHREAEQWNFAVMKYKNISTYVQRQMNNLMKLFREFVKVYIDDVIIFSNILKKHLRHLNEIFQLFDRYNISFKIKKTYLRYSIISFFDQKMNNLKLITSENKLKAIIDFSFFKILKNLKTYLDMIDYLKNYIFYYAQKAEPLQKKKILLLNKKPIQGSSKKAFSIKIIMNNSIPNKLKAFNQLQIDFNKFSWLIHFDNNRVFYANVNVFKIDFEIIVYHRKKKIHDDE